MNTLYLYRKVLSLVSKERKKKLIYSVVLGIVNSLIDVLALSSVFPAVYIATQSQIIHHNKILSQLYNALNFSDTDYFVLFILSAVLMLFLFRMLISLVIFRFQQSVSFDISAEFTEMMGNVFFLKNILDIKKTTIGELDKEIRFLPLQFANFILMPLGMVLSEWIVISVILIGIISFNMKLFIMLMLTIFPIVSVFYYLTRKKIQHYGLSLNNASTLTFNHSREMINGYADIKMQQQSGYFIKRLLQSTRHHNSIQIKINTYQQIIPKILEWSALLSVILIYMYAVLFKENKSEIIVILAVYLASAYRLLPSLNRINSSLLLIKQYEFIIDLFEKAKKQLKLQIPHSNLSPLPFQEKITLKNVCLSYSDNKDECVLKNISFTINKGEVVGFTGKSGAGKTSLMYVISGLLPATSGEIIVDNALITTQNLPAWQKHIAFVYQDIFLINGNILDNIAFGEEKANIEKVWECLKAVQLNEFVKSLPQDIHTPVGESGGYLSGGQKQRLVIARALYRNASVIIMDEATSALDESTQESVMQAIADIAHTHHLTVLLIAHRFSSLKYCNKIICLENGTVSKEVNYKELMSETKN